MRVMVLEEPGKPLTEQERPDPVAGPDGAVIDVIACGVCHSDLHLADGHIGRTPIIPGHEVVGLDAQLGPVMVFAPWGCRRPDCAQCSAGLENICANSREAGVSSDGGYATRMLVPQRDYLVPLGDLDPIQVAPLACGGLTAYRAVSRATAMMPAGGRALVIGAGGLGQYALQFLRRRDGVHLTAADPAESRRQVALDLGADEVSTTDNLDRESFDAIIDFVGAETTLAAATGSIRRGGVVVLVGMYGGTTPFGFGHLPSEAYLTTSIWGSLADLNDLIALARAGEVSHLVETMPLAQANQAHARLRAGDVRGRVVLTVE